MAISTCCTGPFMPRTSSVSAGKSCLKVVWTEFRRSKPEADPKSPLKMSPEIQIKHEDLKTLVDIPRLPHASGNRMLHNFKDFSSLPLMSKIFNISVQRRNSTIRSRKETSMSQLLLMMTDGKSAFRCAKKITRPETERIRSHTHQLMQKKKLVQS